MNRARLLTFLTSAATLTLLACGGAENASLDPGPVGDDGDGGAPSTVEEGGSPDPGPQICPEASGVYSVSPATSNLLFLLDRSGSMHLRVQGEETRWTMTKAGLQTILEALPAGSNAGLAMFPNGDDPISCCEITSANVISCAACGAGELPGPALRCDPQSYLSLPVAVSPLDTTQVGAIMSYVSTADDEFYWGTPLAPALDGAIDAMLGQSTTGVTSVVLLTDGLPTSCDSPDDPQANDIQRAIDAASTGLGAAVRTYVVGVIDGTTAADPENLSAIAQAGGTARYAGCEEGADCAYSVNVDNFEADLQQALDAIALDAISCSFDLPAVSGGAADYEAVNITIRQGAYTITVPRDSNHQDGWDYLGGMSQVQLYGKACQTLKEDVEAKVEVVVGCETVGD
ncbi:MAG: hypothetical protein R3B72_14680 [Polyangiaceae bacterium]